MNFGQKTSLQAATEAAAKVNALLIAKGKLKATPLAVAPAPVRKIPEYKKVIPSSENKPAVKVDLVTAEVEINDTSVYARNLLTRGQIQDQVSRLTGAALSTRGRYMAPEVKNNNPTERPLYIHIQGPDKTSVDNAVHQINMITAKESFDEDAIKEYVPEADKNASKNMMCVQEKVFVGIDSPDSFNIKEKIIGPDESYLRHIRSTTGATVTLCGKGSGCSDSLSRRDQNEPLHIHITHSNHAGLKEAKNLTLNLIETVHSEYMQWQERENTKLLLIQQSIQQEMYGLSCNSAAAKNQPTVILPVIPVSNTVMSAMPSGAPVQPSYITQSHPQQARPEMWQTQQVNMVKAGSSNQTTWLQNEVVHHSHDQSDCIVGRYMMPSPHSSPAEKRPKQAESLNSIKRMRGALGTVCRAYGSDEEDEKGINVQSAAPSTSVMPTSTVHIANFQQQYVENRVISEAATCKEPTSVMLSSHSVPPVQHHFTDQWQPTWPVKQNVPSNAPQSTIQVQTPASSSLLPQPQVYYQHQLSPSLQNQPVSVSHQVGNQLLPTQFQVEPRLMPTQTQVMSRNVLQQPQPVSQAVNLQPIMQKTALIRQETVNIEQKWQQLPQLSTSTLPETVAINSQSLRIATLHRYQ